MASIEEQVEEHCKAKLKSLGVKYYGKTEKINDAITRALDRSRFEVRRIRQQLS